MAADAGKRLVVDDVLSFADDLMGVLGSSNDGDANAQAGNGARMLLSACRSDSDDLELQIREHQEKIRSCKEKVDKVKAETISDDEMNEMENKLEEKLQEEKALRQDLNTAVRDELDNLDLQRASIEEKKNAIKKKEKGTRKAESTLKMCASVTNIIPNLEDQEKTSGIIVNKNGKKIKEFAFENTMSPVEICDKLWKMI